MHPSIHAKNRPDHPAYVIAESEEVVTYAELEHRSNQGAHLFRELGLKAGDHIALMMENNRQFLQIIWAAQRAGLIYTAISSHLKVEETAYIIENCDAKIFITSKKLESIAEQTKQNLSDDIHCFMVNGTAADFRSWDDTCADLPDTPISDESAGDQMLYSSGTTGMPKGIYPMLPRGRAITDMDPTLVLLRDAFGFNENTVYLSPAPLYHAAPLNYNMLIMFMGGTSIIMERFDAELSLKLIDKYKVNSGQFVPIMFVRMLKLDEELRHRYDVSSMKLAIHAAAPCPKEIKQQMIEWWGPILVEYYGSTEGAGVTILNSQQWLAHEGSVGSPIGCQIHIVGDDGEELATGEIGEIYFSGGQRTFEYYKEPEKTAQTRNEKGWVTVGDVGYLDEDGYLYLTDRKNFMIISGGVNVYPQEVENLLVNHDKIADVAVFGLPCEEFGEKVHAVVQPRSWDVISSQGRESLEGELIAWCKERLSPVKTPKSIDFKEVLPRLDNGKLYKRKLVDEYTQG